ncbi:MAG: diguanylate cyclase domain-containing protein [Terracidiphilus sp.]
MSIALAVLFFAHAAHAGQVAAPSAKEPKGGLPTLTTARQAHSLSEVEAARAYPVHLQGVVTYYDPDFGTGLAATFIHDATGSIFVSQTSELARQLFVGALVDVRGVSAPGGFGPIVKNPRIRVLGRAPLPPHPPRVSLAILKTGAYDAQWVEVEGSVHQLIEYAHAVVLNIEMMDGPIAIIMINSPHTTYSNLVGAQIRIDANAAPTMNADGQMIGVHLQAPNLSALQVLEPAPSDPFAGPFIPVNQLLQWGHYTTPMHRVHLRGTVTLQWPGSLLCIRDATRGICAQTIQATPVAVGDMVDISGFVETDNNAPVITDAVFRGVGNNHPVAAKPATVEDILQGGSGSELIQIDGQLIGYDLTSSEVTLQLSSGDTVFPAILPKSLAGTEVSAWKIGSRLRLTGICLVHIVDIQNNVRAGVAVNKSFRVLMRSPADVVVLERPSWWTPGHILVLLSLVLIATLCVLGWVMVLRKRVEEQTVLLRESESRFRHLALHDALTGLATRMLLQDRLDIGVEAAKRHKTGLALLMVDIDRFKQTNDTYGHQAGDEVLRVVAQRLLQAVRKSDTVARMGGDEFVVLLSDLRKPRMAEEIAANIVETLDGAVIFAGSEVPVSVSVGVCTAFAADLDVDFLLRNADAALYQAKAHGRNCYQVFSSEMAPARNK